MAYCELQDLMIGDMIGPDPRDQRQFIDMAAAEMDAKLSSRYAMPLTPKHTALPTYELDLLRFINAKIATGRLIMAKSMDGRQAYALYLLQEADRDLMAIVNGDMLLDAALLDGDLDTDV